MDRLPIGEEVQSWLIYICPITRTFESIIFIVTGCACKINVKNNIEKDTGSILYSVFEIISVILMFLMIFVKVPVIWKQLVLYIPISIFLIIVFAKSEGVISRIFGTMFLRDFAEITYIIYISHETLYYYAGYVNERWLNFKPHVISLIAVIGVICFAYIMRSIHEKKLLRIKL